MARLRREMADAEALLYRVSAEGRRAAARRRKSRVDRWRRALRRTMAAVLAILVAACAWGFVVGPIGQGGFLLVLAALVLVLLVVPGLSREGAETPATLAGSDLARLPARTEAWLQRQRGLLPAPAGRLADGIALRLEALGPQLAALGGEAPAGEELRKLLGVELPELIDGYARVPVNLRREARDGAAPDRQLVEGLRVIDAELARISEELAAGDLRRLATQGRYLELKYKDEGGEQT